MRARAVPAALSVVLAAAAAQPAMAVTKNTAVLQGLDKITARISTFEAPVDQPVGFGTLNIVVRTCEQAPPEEPPENAVFIEIRDERPDAEAVTVFSGWMFSSSPAVSALEHAVYDVWVVDCKNDSSAPSGSESGN